jgi:hypothetical protein
LEEKQRREKFYALQKKVEEVAKKGATTVTLNLSGTLFVVSRETLTHIPYTFFWAMLGKQFGDSLLNTLGSQNWQPDASGHYFIDRDPTHFSRILRYLRTHQWNVSGLNELAYDELLDEVDFYQLEKPASQEVGIHESLPLTSFKGWKLVYREPYSHSTSEENILAADRKFIAVGAKHITRDTISLVAVGLTSKALQRTSGNQTVKDGDVYWYFCKDKSFGFSPVGVVKLTNADTSDVNSSKKLSWHLGKGGFRSGRVVDLNASSEWEKLIWTSDNLYS